MTALVVGGAGAGVVTVDHVDRPAELAASLKSRFGKTLPSRPEVAVALGSDAVRVRRLSVPPVPDEELPAIVAMQASRDAATDAEGLVVDFVPDQATGDSQKTVLAASIDQSTLDYWSELADELGGKLVVVTPRPLASASLSSEAGIVMTAAGDEIDIATCPDGKPCLLRSAKAGAAQADRELRRTLLALNGVEVEVGSLNLVSSVDLEDPSARGIDWEQVAASLGAADASADLATAPSATGLAVGLSRGEKPLLNLADPRKPPVKQTGRRRTVLLAATAATVLLAGLWMAYERVASLDRQIADKEAEIRQARESVEAFEPYRERVAALDAWRRSDVTWLDELERLGRKIRPQALDSPEFAAADDLRVTQLIATALVGGDEPGGRIDLVAQARSTSTSELESRLRDELHPVQPISTAETPAQDAYKYKYNVLLRAPSDVQRKEAEESAEEAS